MLFNPGYSFGLNSRRSAMVLIATFFSFTITGQEWIDRFLNQDQYSFEEIQSAFYDQWPGTDIPRGHGIKQFKRWENYWEYRLLEDGSFPAAGRKEQEMEIYRRTRNNSSRAAGNGTADWRPLGPSTTAGGYAGLGRINSLAFHPVDSNIIYAGAAGGGFWITTNGGQTWTTTTDDHASLGVSGIFVHPTQPNIIYIATGDGDAADNYSTGVMKSTDGGLTFSNTGLNWNLSQNRRIRRLVASPQDPDILLVASTAGIYRTTDAGATWTQEISGNFYDLEPNFNPLLDIYYASTSDDIYRSIDGGNTWVFVTTISGANRIALATTPDEYAYCYALCSDGSGNDFLGLYRSTNDGLTFTMQSNSPNVLGWDQNGNDNSGQGWYDLVIAADPLDGEVVHVGGVNHWKSDDGGVTWVLKSHWYGGGGVQAVHADKHALEWQGNNALWEGNDGGVYVTYDGGDNWFHRSNTMEISQMYRLGVAQIFNSAITGLQDNGTKLRRKEGVWFDEIGGDGMECAIKASNPNVMYGELYYGEIRRSTNGGASWTDIQNNIPGNPSGGWITPFQLDPSDDNSIVMGFKDVYRSTNQGNNWTKISTDLLGGSNISLLNVAHEDGDIIYAGRHNELHRTVDGGTNWTAVSTPGNNTAMLALHPINSDTLWAVRSNWSNGAKVYKSVDGGITWTNITGTLPNLPARCILYQQGTANGLYVGMDNGVYYKDDTMPDWELFNDGLPNAEISELDINYDESKLYAATYGRGLWKSDTYVPAVPCPYPSQIDITEVTISSASISWEKPCTNPASYEYIVKTDDTVPVVPGTSVPDTFVTVPGLIYGPDYWVFIRANCGGDGFSEWNVHGPFKILPSCDDIVYDTGGVGSDYGDNEDYSVKICAEHSIEKVTLTFFDFSVETAWDALYIHDGPDINSPIFDSGNPPTSAGFPAGGYYGNTIPGPFTSTDTTGCLTLRFLSDSNVNWDGWELDVSCTPNCGLLEVTRTDDYVYGSIRNLAECLNSGDTIHFHSNVEDQIHELENTIIFSKNLTIDQGINSTVTIESDLLVPALVINSGTTVTLNYLELTGQSSVEVIRNFGNLEIEGLIITGPNMMIDNRGTLTIKENGVLQIKK